MVLVSLSAFRFPKRMGLFLAGLVAVTASAFAQPILLPVESTPYDRQMARVQPTLASPPRAAASRIQMTSLNQWMGKLRDIPYRYSKRWKTPAEVRSAKAADCKGKAVALYHTLRAHGARHVRVVIGKHRAENPLTHAWVEWETTNGTYLLDPTFESKVAQAAPDRTTYIPFYAYEGAQKYRAASAMFVGNSELKTAQSAPAWNVKPVLVRASKSYRSVNSSRRR